MRMTRTPSGKSFALFLALAGAATLSVTVAHAGFQWVPPTGAEAPAATSDGSIPPAEPVPTGDVDQVVLPLPGEEQIPAEPQLQPADAAPVNAARPAPGQTLQLPPGYQAEPLPPPAPAQNQNVLKVKTVTPAPQAPAQPAPMPANEPVSLQPVSPPPAPPQQAEWSSPPPAAPVTQTKVIVPQDAPQSAVDNTPNSERLVINPYPDSHTPAQPAPVAVAPQAAPAQQQYSDMPVIEGFGSDMPLALAVQQIVPPDYAYAFEGSVNAGQTVSWDGGKAWDLVINDMLAPLRLEAVIAGKTVHIQPQGLQRQSALAPAQQGSPRRANINDPGEQSQLQDASSLAGIESAAGDAQAPAAPQVANAVPPTQGETQAAPAAEQLPTPAEINGQQQTSIDSEMPGEQQAAAPSAEWDAKAGESLKDILTRWSQKAGVELIWMAAYDYKIKNDITLQDSFPNAVQSIVNSGIDSETPPEVEITAKADTQQPSSVLIRDKRA
jgi:hypothetical protein